MAYYSGWRKQEILQLTWEEIDWDGRVIRLSPARSKTLTSRILPMSAPITAALRRRLTRRDPQSPLVFHRDGIPVRRLSPSHYGTSDAAVNIGHTSWPRLPHRFTNSPSRHWISLAGLIMKNVRLLTRRQ